MICRNAANRVGSIAAGPGTLMAVSAPLREPGVAPARAWVEFDLEPADFADSAVYHRVKLGGSMDSRRLRRSFAVGLLAGLRVVWPILSILLVLIIALGLVVGLLEGWSIHESIYFAFVSGLTIGYGDLAPKSLLTRALAIAIGVCGVLVTALVAAIAVKALTAATGDGEKRELEP